MKPKFKIGQKVWLTIESDVGVVQDIIYRYSTGTFEYSVCFGWGNYCACDEYELLSSKNFN